MYKSKPVLVKLLLAVVLGSELVVVVGLGTVVVVLLVFAGVVVWGFTDDVVGASEEVFDDAELAVGPEVDVLPAVVDASEVKARSTREYTVW